MGLLPKAILRKSEDNSFYIIPVSKRKNKNKKKRKSGKGIFFKDNTNSKETHWLSVFAIMQ